jgi:flotillin
MDILLNVLPWLLGAIIVAVIGGLSYVKAPPDTAFIISGIRRRMIIGKAGLRFPLLERLDKLTLRLMTVDVKTERYVPTNEYINVKVDGVVKIKIKTDEASIKMAAQNFLNMSTDDIVREVKDVLEGNMREIIGQMSLAEMVTDRKAFGERVQENAVPDLDKMGLEVISFNVQDFFDDQDVIVNLGIDNISKIKKTAAIAKAEAEKEIAIAQAEADTEANDARVTADTDIAQKLNQLEIKRAELKEEADKKKASADMAYEIQKQESRKALEQETAEADNVRAEKQILISQNILDAEVKKKADADRYRKNAEADAELYERTKQAEAIKAEAKAEAEAILAKNKAEAEGIQAIALAEADGIRAKALAEADGIDKKADAMEKYGTAAIMEMYFNTLPEVARGIGDPLSKVDKITMFGEGNNAKLIQDIVNGITKVNDGVGASLGFDIKEWLTNVVSEGDFFAKKNTQEENTEPVVSDDN